MTKKPKRGRPQGTATGTESLFALWRDALGMGAKQVTEAGTLIGIKKPGASRRNQGSTPSDLTEQLAMAAVRAGLPPWSPKTDAEILTVRQAMGVMRSLAENQVRPPSKAK